MTGRRFSQGPPVSSTNKTDRHDITEILLKMALNTIKQTNKDNKIRQYNLFIYITRSSAMIYKNVYCNSLVTDKQLTCYQKENISGYIPGI